MREHTTMEAAWKAALEAVEPAGAVRWALETDRLARFVDEAADDLVVIAFGKAGHAMIRGAIESGRSLLGDSFEPRGVVADPAGDRTGEFAVPGGIERYDTGHPRPDGESIAAGRRVLELVEPLGPGDRVLVLVSGGGSASLAAPVCGVGADELRRMTETLLKSGRDIAEINAVRKHISRLKGGRLARAFHPASWQTLAISDVVGDRPDTIASGPTVADRTSFRDAVSVVETVSDSRSVPASVERWIRAGVDGRRLETPRRFAGDRDRRRFSIVAGNRDALEAAGATLERSGLRVVDTRGGVTGAARRRGAEFVDRLLSVTEQTPQDASDSPRALVWGGEVTVQVEGDHAGTGGPCQEFVLAAASRLAELDSHLDNVSVTIGALTTDGIDGPTDAAGAIVIRDLAREFPVREARRALDQHDSTSFLDKHDCIVRTGPTETNVNDLYLGIVD